MSSTLYFSIILFLYLQLIELPIRLLQFLSLVIERKKKYFENLFASCALLLVVKVLILWQRHQKCDENAIVLWFGSTDSLQFQKVISYTKFYHFLGRSGIYQYLLGYGRCYVFEQVDIWRRMVDPSWRFHCI